MKIILEYDPTTGQLTDAAGLYLVYASNLNHFGIPNEGNSNSKSTEISLMLAQGATPKDIIEMKKEGLL